MSCMRGVEKTMALTKSIVYILGISTYGAFEAKDATLDSKVAKDWLETETEPDTMAVYKRVNWQEAPDAPSSLKLIYYGQHDASVC